MSGEGAGHFTLDLDPDQLDVALAKMQSMGKDFAQRATKLLAMPGDIGDSWTGKAAKAAKQEMTGLGEHLQSFSTAMSDSRKAVKKLKVTYEEAVEKVGGLNAQWEAASTTYTAAVAAADREFERRSPEPEVPIHQDFVHGSAKRSARFALESTQNSLVTQFDELRTEVKRATRTCA